MSREIAIVVTKTLCPCCDESVGVKALPDGTYKIKRHLAAGIDGNVKPSIEVCQGSNQIRFQAEVFKEQIEAWEPAEFAR